MAIALGLCSLAASADTGVNDLSKSQAFTVNASVVKGCLLGNGASDATTFGNLNFGQVATLSGNLSIVSSVNAGSVVMKCNPGLSVTLTLGIGNHVSGSVTGGRKLQKDAGTETLVYQLYQDSNYSIIWGDDSNGGAAQRITASGSSQEIKIYARLFAASILPSSGIYRDTVLLTVTY
ncbi:spore coat U domain-containing protein [Serratia sp. AKBS12]|uniref:Csu type fimbrial protein n=1 Tax=Serratia sp. AKBS12 TaxID=2974597 RepID=UPI00286D3B9F|nr:spore coat U domain-containing protein [Serratia sp. AKBS12]HEI8865283.1 spore coat protein U domain-containing protein [Serratia odorifera]